MTESYPLRSTELQGLRARAREREEHGNREMTDGRTDRRMDRDMDDINSVQFIAQSNNVTNAQETMTLVNVQK